MLRQDYADEQIPAVSIAAPGARLANLSFTGCDFEGITVSAVECCPPEERVAIVNVAARRCRGSVDAHGALFDEVLLDTWKGAGRAGPRLQRCVFHHSTLTGVIERLDIGSDAFGDGPDAEYQQAYIDDNDARYREMDWAVDVSDAVFSNCRIRGIAHDKICCDRETQAVITTESMRGAADVFNRVDLVGTIGMQIQFHLDGPDGFQPEGLIWIEATSDVRRQELDLIAMLHEHGLALPILTPTPADRADVSELDPIIDPPVRHGDPTTALRLVVTREMLPDPDRAQPPGPQVAGRSLVVDDTTGSVDGTRFEGERFDRFIIGPDWTASPDDRLVIRGTEFRRCSFDKASITKTLIEDARFDTIGCPYPTTIGGLNLQECALRHVVLAGNVEHLTIQPLGPTADITSPEQRRWAEANDQIHAEADWVLDVSDAQLIACRLRGLPADKIRYDPRRQAVVTPESLSGASDAFTDLELVGVVGFAIRQALLGRDAHIRYEPILWADPRHDTMDQELQLIRRLHDRNLTVQP